MAEMRDWSQFGSDRPQVAGNGRECARFEAMLADAVDGLLLPEDQAALEEHLLRCAECGVSLAGAREGAAWLEVLRIAPPEPPASLVDRILAETSVRTAADQEAARATRRVHAESSSLLSFPAAAVGSSAGVSPMLPGTVLPFRSRIARRLQPIPHLLLQPRLIMTAAMAFFSIALTLNLTGIHMSDLRASDLSPSSLRRSFYMANAHVARYYDNLRVVYELESRVHDLQRSSDGGAGAGTTPEPDQPGSGGDGATPAPSGPGTEQPGKPTGKAPEGQPKNKPAAVPHAGSSRSTSSAEEVVPAAWEWNGGGHRRHRHGRAARTPLWRTL